MKRDASLQDLSRDHFTALHHCTKVKRVVEGAANAKDPALVRSDFLAFADGPMRGHFAEEEELLVPHLRPDHRERLKSDHAAIWAIVARAQGRQPTESPVGDGDPIIELAERLREHIRWEEDVAFQALQDDLDPAGLARLLEQNDTWRQAQGLPVGPP